MVLFNELRISNDKTSLKIDCQIEGLEIYNTMYIKQIYVDYYKNASVSSGYSDKAIKIYDDSSEERASVATCLDVTDPRVEANFGISTFDGGLFYVIVYCDIKSGANMSSSLSALISLPCGFNDTRDVGVILDWEKVYNIGMQYVADLAGRCNCSCADNKGFDNFILIWNALKLSMESCDYPMINLYWDKYIRTFIPAKFVGTSTGCGCNS